MEPKVESQAVYDAIPVSESDDLIYRAVVSLGEVEYKEEN